MHPGYSPQYASPYGSSGGYYPPQPNHRYSTATPSPRASASKSKHRRHSSQQHTSSGYAYAPRASQQYADGWYASAAHQQASPPRRPDDFVSGYDYYYKGEQTRPRAPSHHQQQTYSSGRPRSSKQSREIPRFSEHTSRHGSFYPTTNVYDVYDDTGTPPPPFPAYAKYATYTPADYRKLWQDRHFQERERAREASRHHERDEPKTPKANSSRRRSSTFASDAKASGGGGGHHRSHTAAPRPQSHASKRKATEADRIRMGIPAGYSMKNWDPTEEPIVVLGSVFDANSLGKWIYDWACFAFGTNKPLTDMAAELWLLLIHLAGKFKRADDILDRVRYESKRELVSEFIDSGERLWIRFRKLLKICEDYMWKAAQKETGQRKPASMGTRSGVAFVKCLFGRDCELEKTEMLMASIRLFSVRFEANIEPVIRNPDAEESDEESESEDEYAD